jgi:exopolysaccharide production protein ExoZ
MARVVFFGSAAFLLVLGAAQFDLDGRVWKPLIFLGDASYSLYLGHMIIFEMTYRLMGRFDHPVVALAAVVALGAAAYRAVERPLIDISRHLARQTFRTGGAPIPEAVTPQ